MIKMKKNIVNYTTNREKVIQKKNQWVGTRQQQIKKNNEIQKVQREL